MAETKVNVIGTLTGTVTGIKEPEDKALVKSRKGKETGQSKFNQNIQLVGVTWDEWYKRCDAAIAILNGGKMGKAPANVDKRLADAELQITELTEQLDQVKADLEQKTAELEQLKADSEQK